MQSNPHAHGRETAPTGHDESAGRESTHDHGDALVELLGDEYTREILAAVSKESLSAGTLVDRLDMSRATVYRRLDRLHDHGLVATDTTVSPDGNHYEVFEAALRRLTFDISGGSPTVIVERCEDDNDRAPSKTLVSAD